MKFRKHVEIPRKQANSTAQLKIPPSAENCGHFLSTGCCRLYLVHSHDNIPRVLKQMVFQSTVSKHWRH